MIMFMVSRAKVYISKRERSGTKDKTKSEIVLVRPVWVLIVLETIDAFRIVVVNVVVGRLGNAVKRSTLPR